MESEETTLVQDLCNFLDGGRDKTELKSLIYNTIRRDRILYNPRPFDMTEREARELSVRQLHRVIQIGQNADKTFFETLIHTMSSYDQSFEFRAGVHYGLFGNAVVTQGTQEQVDKWFTMTTYVLSGS